MKQSWLSIWAAERIFAPELGKRPGRPPDIFHVGQTAPRENAPRPELTSLSYHYGLRRAAFTMATWLSVSVCVCHTLIYCAQTTELIIMRPSPDCSPAILVFTHQNMNPIARADPLIQSVKWKKGGQKSESPADVLSRAGLWWMTSNRKIRPTNRSHPPDGSSWHHNIGIHKRRAVWQRQLNFLLQ